MPAIEPTEARRLLQAAPLSAALRALAERGPLWRYPKGHLLLEEGDHGDMLYVIVSGSVRAFSSDGKGGEIIYGDYPAGDYVGEMSLDGGLRSASVVTLVKTVCARVTRHTLRAHIAADPDFAFELLARVIRRARLATSNARSMALLDVYGRMRLLFDELARPLDDGSRAITPKPTHAEIASRIGCSRAMVSRLMKDLLRHGAIVDLGDTWILKGPLPTAW